MLRPQRQVILPLFIIQLGKVMKYQLDTTISTLSMFLRLCGALIKENEG